VTAYLNGRDLGEPAFEIRFREPQRIEEVRYWGLPELGLSFSVALWIECDEAERAVILELCHEDYRQRLIAWRGEKAALRCRRRFVVAVGSGDAA
jgi:hypothetical protein